MADEREIELIQSTIRDIQYSIDRLHARVEEDLREIAAKRQRIAAWKQRLAQLKGPTESTTETRRRRSPKGANLSTIMTYVETTPGGASASEIQRTTELPWSSVQSILKKHRHLFIEEKGVWKLAPEARKSVDLVSNGITKN